MQPLNKSRKSVYRRLKNMVFRSPFTSRIRSPNSQVSDKLNISVHELADQHSPICRAWLAILDQLDDYLFYQHPGWFYALNKHLFADSIQFVLLADDDGPLAILPLVSCVNRLGGKVLCAPQHDHIVLNDWIIRDKEDVPALIDAMPDIARSLGLSDWSRLQLDGLPCSSFLFHENRLHFADRMPWRERQILLKKVRESAWFDTRCLDTHFSSKLLKNLRSRLRKAQAMGDVRFTFTTTVEQTEEAFEDFLQIEASGWKGAWGSSTAIAQDECLTAFYRELIDQSWPGLVAQINTMYIGDTAVSAQLALNSSVNCCLLKIGYRESYANCAPGSLLLFEVLKNTAENKNINKLSLLTSPQWAQRWHPKQGSIYNVTLYNSTVRGRVSACRDMLQSSIKRQLETEESSLLETKLVK